MSILYFILLVIVVVSAWAVVSYNGFIRRRNQKDESWADIDVQLKRRYDLIPNLINTVKGYADHESQTFTQVTEARTRAMGAQTITERTEAENTLTNTLKSLFAISESYPELKANENFAELQRELADTENKIQAARRFYNTNVRDWNTGVDSFPSNLIASAFKFKKADFFELAENEAEARQPVEVKF